MSGKQRVEWSFQVLACNFSMATDRLRTCDARETASRGRVAHSAFVAVRLLWVARMRVRAGMRVRAPRSSLLFKKPGPALASLARIAAHPTCERSGSVKKQVRHHYLVLPFQGVRFP